MGAIWVDSESGKSFVTQKDLLRFQAGIIEPPTDSRTLASVGPEQVLSNHPEDASVHDDEEVHS